MRKQIAFAVCLLGVASPARADELPLDPMADTLDETEVIALVAIGDRERAAGRPAEAAVAYAKAIKLRRDPLVVGRLGVLLVQLGHYARAADLLHEALKLSRTTPKEREEFFRAHEIARAHGAWIDVMISHAGAQVTFDGAARNPNRLSAFTMFVLAGKHELVARLDGYEEVRVALTVEAGGDQRVAVNFDKPLFPQLPAKAAKAAALRSAPPMAPSTNVVGDPNYNRQEDPFYEEPKPGKTKDADEARPVRGSIFAGPVVVFGVASWMPAVGGVIGGSWRPNQYFSLGLEGRAAWLTVGVGGEPISAMTAGGLLSACGHVKWFFGCALGHLGVVRGQASGATFLSESYSSVKVGVGGRVGVQKKLARSFSVSAAVDAHALNSGIRVRLGNLVLADQPPIMLSTQILGKWDF